MVRAPYAATLKRVDSGQGDAGQYVSIIPDLLTDSDSGVRFVGIKWIADENLQQHAALLEQLLERDDLTRRDLRAILAALAKITEPTSQEFSPDDKLLKLVLDETKPMGLREISLQTVNTDHPQLTVATLESLLDGNSATIQQEAVQILAIHSDSQRTKVLSKVAGDESRPANLRADAIAGLASLAADHSELLHRLASNSNPTIANEAHRSLVSSGMIQRTLREKPSANDLPAWHAMIDNVPGEADRDVGRRLFFHSKLGGCYKCHAVDGRGHEIGPDLTTIHNQTDITKTRLLEHILNPNAEMAPYYRPQQLLTFDGQVMTGLIVGREGQRQGYVGSNGNVFYVNKNDVEARRELTTSIMPSGLLDAMTVGEIRNLLAFLLSHEERHREND